MHSRIIELSKEPVLKQERISEASIPEWFCNTIADYTDTNTRYQVVPELCWKLCGSRRGWTELHIQAEGQADAL